MKNKVVGPINENNRVNPRTTPRGRTEKDLDEQVHSGEVEIGELNNEDPDDRVHQLSRKVPTQLKAEDNPQDADDLVHENDEEDVE